MVRFEICLAECHTGTDLSVKRHDFLLHIPLPPIPNKLQDINKELSSPVQRRIFDSLLSVQIPKVELKISQFIVTKDN